MEIKVYTDTSKIRKKSFGAFTLREFISILLLLVVLGIELLNIFLWQLPDIIFQPLTVLMLIGIVVCMGIPIKGMPIEKYIRLRYRWFIKEKKRIYQTERIKQYHHHDFKTSKKIK